MEDLETKIQIYAEKNTELENQLTEKFKRKEELLVDIQTGAKVIHRLETM